MARAEGVGQHDAQVAVVVLLPVGQHPIRRLGQLTVVAGERGIDHRQLVGVGADGLHLAAHGDQAVGGAEEGGAEALDHGLHAPVLPQEAVAAARAEVGDAHLRQQLQAPDLLPHARHGPGVEHLQLEEELPAPGLVASAGAVLGAEQRRSSDRVVPGPRPRAEAGLLEPGVDAGGGSE